jgi:opacity protein-like surface antigen
VRSRHLILSLVFLWGFVLPAVGGAVDQAAPSANEEVVEQPYKFSAEFDIDQAYLGDGDVARGHRHVDNFDEYYSNLLFVFTPRIKFGILRLGGQWERYSFDFPNGGEQLPNTLQASNAIVGLDTKFSDSILVRFETQPGFYGTTFDHLDGDSFNIPFVLGGTYIYSPDLQFVLGIGVNVQSHYPVLPGGGIRWNLGAGWLLNAVLPTPRLEYQLNRNVTLFAGADIKANTFRVDDHFGDSHGDTSLNSAWLTYEEIRAGAGVEWKVNSSLALTIEGGYVPYREFDFHRTDVRYHYESGSPYGGFRFHGEF